MLSVQGKADIWLNYIKTFLFLSGSDFRVSGRVKSLQSNLLNNLREAKDIVIQYHNQYERVFYLSKKSSCTFL